MVGAFGEEGGEVMFYMFASLFFVLLQAFFSGIETGLVSSRRSRVEHGAKSGGWSARVLLFFVDHPEIMLSTTLVGTNICVVCAASMAGRAAEAFGYGTPGGMVVATVALTLVLLAAEIIPKDWFRQAPYERCLIFAAPLALSYVVLYLPVRAMAALTAMLTRRFSGGRERSGAAALLREDFRVLIRESESGGEMDSETADILDKALDFHGLRVADVMVPLDRVVAVPANATVAQAMDICLRNGVSGAPVGSSGGSLDWKGVFSIYDAMFELPEGRWGSIGVMDRLRPLRVVREDDGIAGVLKSAKGAGIAILAVGAADAPSKVIGVVTTGDVAKSLFGE